jgi:hypothetical protein
MDSVFNFEGIEKEIRFCLIRLVNLSIAYIQFSETKTVLFHSRRTQQSHNNIPLHFRWI